MYEGPERRSDAARLARIEQLLESDSESRREFRERIDNLLAKHSEVLYGNGRPGVLTRLVELETAHKNHQTNIRWAWGTVGALVITQFWKIFTGSFVK